MSIFTEQEAKAILDKMNAPPRWPARSMATSVSH
jgi:hypothetical protein